MHKAAYLATVKYKINVNKFEVIGCALDHWRFRGAVKIIFTNIIYLKSTRVCHYYLKDVTFKF